MLHRKHCWLRLSCAYETHSNLLLIIIFDIINTVTGCEIYTDIFQPGEFGTEAGSGGSTGVEGSDLVTLFVDS